MKWPEIGSDAEGTGSGICPPNLSIDKSLAAIYYEPGCWCQAKDPSPSVINDVSLLESLSSLTGLSVGLLIYWSINTLSCLKSAFESAV
jgi:hypothetical protein